jgi:predicted nucleotidyltransferase
MTPYTIKTPAEILFGQTKANILAELIAADGDAAGIPFREVVRMVSSGRGGVERAIQSLIDVGLVRETRVGRENRPNSTRLLAIDRSSELYRPTRDIVERSLGIYRRIVQALRSPELNVTGAFVFGSQASGLDRPDSDIDLFVLTPLSKTEIEVALSDIGSTYGRLISVLAFDQSSLEDRERLKYPAYLTAILGPKMVLLNPDEVKHFVDSVQADSIQLSEHS